MIRFSDLFPAGFWGKLFRSPLALLPKATVLPILQGPGKGLKWIVGSGVHGCWLGSYEARKQQLLPSLVREGDIVLDVGANAGFFTLILSRLVGGRGKVLAFEPLPENLTFLDRHIELNKMRNVEVFRAAVGKRIGKAMFDVKNSHYEGKLSDSGNLEVEILSLDSLKNLDGPVTLIKIDVEGGEGDVLEGAENFLKKYKPVILLATHGKKQAPRCKELLNRYGFSMRPMRCDSELENCSEWIAEASL